MLYFHTKNYLKFVLIFYFSFCKYGLCFSLGAKEDKGGEIVVETFIGAITKGIIAAFVIWTVFQLYLYLFKN